MRKIKKVKVGKGEGRGGREGQVQCSGRWGGQVVGQGEGRQVVGVGREGACR